MYNRYLKLNLSQGDSAFLWGARKTGKSTYLKTLYPNSARFDFLNTSIYFRYTKAPWKFREDILQLDPSFLALPIIIDEVQKIPSVMDEIHLLIEEYKLAFILCGSSTRKMRQVGVNLLGGRALKYHFYPLVYPEIKNDFDLVKVFNHGLIPAHYNQDNAKERLEAYVEDYLISEIQSEALVRDLASFARFFDSVAFSHGQLINYSNIARDVGVSAITVKEHYQILVDTLVGYFVEPYHKNPGRDIISSTAKFYFFDLGIANHLMDNVINSAKGIEAGRSLEHYIFLELYAYIKLHKLSYKIGYWLTKSGLEVDFILYNKRGEVIPIEVKISENVHKTEFKGLKAFMKAHSVKKGYMICMEDVASKVSCEEGEIIISPIREFLDDLWDGRIVGGK